jgi:hypothetical protein
MTRSVTFNGTSMFRPGGLVKVDASQLNSVGLATNGVVGLLGEADGGVNNEAVIIDDPTTVKDIFESGPLADAVGPLFAPSVDPRVPGGAFRAVCVKVNQGSAASATFYNTVVSDTVAAGSSTTVLNLTTGGYSTNQFKTTNLCRVAGVSRFVVSSTASTVTVSPAFPAIPATGSVVQILAPDMTVTSVGQGVKQNQISMELEQGVNVGEAWSTTFNGKTQNSPDSGGKAFLQVQYIGQSTTVIQAAGTTDGAGSTTTLVNSAAGFPTGGYNTKWVLASGGTLTQPNIRKLSNTSTTILTVSNAFMNGASVTTPGVGATYSVRDGVVYSGLAAAAGSSTITLPSTVNVAANELNGLLVAIEDGSTGEGQVRVVASHTAGVSSVVTVSEPWVTVPTAAVFDLRNVTVATGTVHGSAGVATSFTTTVTANGQAQTGLSLTFSPNETLRQLATSINSDTNYYAVVPSGINQDTSLCKYLDFDLGAVGVELRNDLGAVTSAPTPSLAIPATWPNSFRQDLNELVKSINGTSQIVTAARDTSTAYLAGSGRPEWTASSVVTNSTTVVPVTTKATLSGGLRGTSTNTDWQNAFDLLLGERCTSVVPLISEDLVNEGYGSSATFASVAAQLAAHLDVANGIGKSERGAYVGMKGTATQVVAFANSLNNADIQVTSQADSLLGADGSLKTFPEWGHAVLAAGMRAGMPEVGEPLTHKYIGTYGVSQDNSWAPTDLTDANYFIQNGILFSETVRGKGTRWVRDLTSYVQDDNLAFSEGSVRDVVRYVSYGLRTTLEDEFTGVKAKPANAQAIKDVGTNYLSQVKSQNIIVDSTDPRTGQTINAYHDFRVSISGDVASITVAIFPVVGINFQLITIFLQLPSQSA